MCLHNHITPSWDEFPSSNREKSVHGDQNWERKILQYRDIILGHEGGELQKQSKTKQKPSMGKNEVHY